MVGYGNINSTHYYKLSEKPLVSCESGKNVIIRLERKGIQYIDRLTD